jgi:hypothetical protein
MLPAFVVSETTVQANGESAPVEIGRESRPNALLVTLGITHVVEQEALLVSLHGSPDGTAWNTPPLAIFPQKFYTGVSSIMVDLAGHPDVSFLRAQWKVARWGRGDKTPNFRFYVFAEPA